MMIYIVFALLIGSVYSDFDCLCNYNVEKSVYTSASNQGQPIGYLYEFDCKQILGDYSDSQTWATVAFEHKVGYIEKDAQTNSQVCPGSPPAMDIVPTTTTATTMETSTASTTMKQTTRSTTSTQTTTGTTTAQTTTSTTMEPTRKSTTIKPTSTTMITQPTITPTKPSIATLVCPLKVQQAAQAERSLIFVNGNNGKCYELVTYKRSWTFAEEDCINKGGHLTSIETMNENNLLYGYVKSYGSNAWIGLNDKNSEEHFKWTSGDTLTYENWQSGRKDPLTHFTQDCVLMDSNNGHWDDKGCADLNAYICKFDAVPDNGTHVTQLQTQTHTTSITLPTTTSGSEHLSCPQNILLAASRDGGIVFVSGETRKCYELVRNHLTWENAESDCQTKGGHLATVGSLSVENLLYGYVQSYGHETWIGLHDRNREEQFEWISGDPVNYLNWHNGRKNPFTHRFEDCVAMGSLTGTWEDMDCLYNYKAYICEFDAVSGNQGSYTNVDGNTQLCSSSVRHLAARDNTILGQYERGCYELIQNNKVSWQNGEDKCQSRGGHLAHISNAQQQSFIQAFLEQHSPQHAVWIGLHDTNIEGAFEWTAGTSVSYTNWVANHDSNFETFRTEDCVAFIPYKNGKWDDIPCGDTFDFGETHPLLCQYKVPLSPGIVG